MHATTAGDRLRLGDEVLRRMAAGETAQEVAAALGIGSGLVTKSSWLAKVYDADARAEIGDAVLDTINASHLEIVARLDARSRAELLIRVATERLSVRNLRSLVSKMTATVSSSTQTYGATDDLARVGRALETYSGWDDQSLDRLLAGPNGKTITRLVQACQALATRIRGTPS